MKLINIKLKTKDKNKLGSGSGFPTSTVKSASASHCLPLSLYQRRKKFKTKLWLNPTPAEKKLKSILEEQKIEFKFQYLIAPYIADFYFPKKRLIIEIDGAIHNSRRAKIHDIKRESYFLSVGLFTYRLKNYEIHKIDSVFDIFPDIEIEKREKLHKLISTINEKSNHKQIDIIEPSDIKDFFAIIGKRERAKRKDKKKRYLARKKLRLSITNQ